MINVIGVYVHDEVSSFGAPFKLEVSFDCVAPGIKEDLEWKLIYVGSASDEKLDQELESVIVGPVVTGRNKFLFEAPAPKSERIPNKDLRGVTVLLLTCSYKDKEFIRIGYYVNNDYADPQLREEAEKNPEHKVDSTNLQREVLAQKPRITRFIIPWDEPIVDLTTTTPTTDDTITTPSTSTSTSTSSSSSSSSSSFSSSSPTEGVMDEQYMESNDDDSSPVTMQVHSD